MRTNQPSWPLSRPIDSGRGEYTLSGVARLASGIALLAAAWYLSRTWIIMRRLATPLVPGIFALSAAFTAVSGALAVALASMASDAVNLGAQSSTFARAETISDVRWLTGTTGFALAGLALVLAARYQWRVGGVLRYVALVSAALGIAMQFIWVNSATVAHPIVGTAFLIWLVGVGMMLLTGRTERLFTRYVDDRAAN